MSDKASNDPTAATLPLLGDRFDAAVTAAIDLHRSQLRKGTAIPYVSHLFAVCSLVLESGGTEDEAIAALLHDAVEDQGGAPTLTKIRDSFGENVAAIVEACSAIGEGGDTSSLARKRAYVHHLDRDDTPRSALLVSAADKLHNLRCILRDHRGLGEDLWGRFNVGPPDQVFFYSTLTDVYRRRLGGPLADELETLCPQLAAIVDPTKLEWARIGMMPDCAFAGLGDPAAINAAPSAEPSRSGWIQRSDPDGLGMAFGFAEVDGLPIEIGLAGSVMVAARLEFVDDVDELADRGEGSWVPLGRFRCNRVHAIDLKHPDQQGYRFDLSLPPAIYTAEAFRSGSDAVGLRLVPG
jgi:hypothetical protein